jgi:hypothetical protein
MTVLTLAGKPINWANPPKPTDRVMWSKKASNGKKVTGSLRTIAHLDTLDALARAEFGQGLVILQPPYNTGVKASAGTHDYDGCWDGYIPGVSWERQQTFLRKHGFACWWRRPPAFGNHIHGFTLPPREGREVSDDFASHGFKVGKYVDGGYSLYGRKVASSQISDYYNHRNALAGHAHDPSWFPSNIAATIFNLDAYIKIQKEKTVPKKPVKRTVLGLSWNLLVNRKASVVARELTSLLRTNGRPKFASVQEARGYRKVLKSVGALLRYTVLQPKDRGPKPHAVQVREAGSTALLIRKGVPVQQTGELRMNRDWVGPKAGLRHEGRVFPWAVLMLQGQWTLVIAVHMPWGKHASDLNKTAWDETMSRIEELAKSLNLPFIIVGDWNDPWSSTGPRSPQGLANRLDGKVVHTDTRIDYAVKRLQSVKVTKASARTSDHPAIRIEKK